MRLTDSEVDKRLYQIAKKNGLGKRDMRRIENGFLAGFKWCVGENVVNCSALVNKCSALLEVGEQKRERKLRIRESKRALKAAKRFTVLAHGRVK